MTIGSTTVQLAPRSTMPAGSPGFGGRYSSPFPNSAKLFPSAPRMPAFMTSALTVRGDMTSFADFESLRASATALFSAMTRDRPRNSCSNVLRKWRSWNAYSPPATEKSATRHAATVTNMTLLRIEVSLNLESALVIIFAWLIAEPRSVPRGASLAAPPRASALGLASEIQVPGHVHKDEHTTPPPIPSDSPATRSAPCTAASVMHSCCAKTKKPQSTSDDQKWCSREDSNLHGLPHTVLSRARLPIPPHEHFCGAG